MATRRTGTEDLIKTTAKRIFFAEGKLHATTQDIANAAGITRTVINYYFRSKDTLFAEVFEEAMEETHKKLDEVLLSPLPIKEKIVKFIDLFFAEVSEYPYRESFLISEINGHGFNFPEKEPTPVLKQFLKEIESGMEKGEIRKMIPTNFVINLFSLVAYPLLARKLFKHVLDITDDTFAQLMEERKKMIVDISFI